MRGNLKLKILCICNKKPKKISILLNQEVDCYRLKNKMNLKYSIYTSKIAYEV